MKKYIKLFFGLITSLFLLLANVDTVNASSAKISVSSSTSKVVVGNTFTVTVKISSSTDLGSWEWTISYDKTKLKLQSGESNVADMFQKTGTKSQSYTYKFKAIGTGSSNITVKSYGAFDINENKMSVSVSSKTISVITQAQLEASYSKNNYLKSLSVEGLKLDSEFSKDKTEYKVEADSNTEEIKIKAIADDSKASITGNGTHSVSEGENKFNITVTAENGSTKTYTLIVNVKDPNPIVIKIDNKELTVIKRESSLKTPEGFEKITIELNEQKVPSFYNELNDFTLIGLKDSDGNTELYLYDINNQKYTKYVEVMMNDVKLFPLQIDKSFKETTTTSANILSIINEKFNDDEFISSKVIIDGIEFEALKQNINSEYSIIHARDILTGKDNYYTYDSITNTVIRYDEKGNKLVKEKINDYKKLILALGIETIIIIVVLISMLFKQVINNKKRRKLYEELENRKQKEVKIKEINNTKEKKDKSKKTNKKKMIIEDDKEKEKDI